MNSCARLQLAITNEKFLVFQRAFLAQKYDPEQPRVPSGEPDAGQWTSDGINNAAEWRASNVARRSIATCERQYERDLNICRMTANAACYAQAMERLQACTNGRQIPPLSF